MVVSRKPGKRKEEMGSGGAVYLNVYDLTPMNGYAYWVGLGVYHSGVEVHGVEYAFGAHDQPTSGIFQVEPKHCDGFTFRKTLFVGNTELGPTEVRSLIEDLADDYRGNAYNLITRNCNHFCNHACLRLTANPIPSWVNRLARIGLMCNCVLPLTLNSTKVRHHTNTTTKALEEGEKKKLTSDSNNSPLSSSSPSSSPRRGRSRTRRPLPPSSPLIVGSSAS